MPWLGGAAAGVVALGFLPAVGEKLGEPAGGVPVDATENVVEVGEGLDSDNTAGLDEGEEDAGGVAAVLTADEEPMSGFPIRRKGKAERLWTEPGEAVEILYQQYWG